MADFIRTEEKVVNVGEPVVFENNTDSDFSVSAAVVFRKSGLYDVSIVGRRTIISKLPEIIRCKDCKHRPIEKYGEIMPPKEDGWDDLKCPCLCEDYFYSWRPKDDWYCANAERRTDD